MSQTKFQVKMDKERWNVIKKFQRDNKTSEEKVEALKQMENKDIEFLIYCSDNIYAKMFYSKFLKK